MAIRLNSSTSFTGKDLTSTPTLITYTTEKDYLIGARVDLGKSTELLDSAASELTFYLYIDDVQAYKKVVPKSSGITTISHNYDKVIFVKSGQTITIKVYSDNSSDTSISGDVYITSTGTKLLNSSTSYSSKSITSSDTTLLTYTADGEARVLFRIDLGSGSDLLPSQQAELTIKGKITTDTTTRTALKETILKASGLTQLIFGNDDPIHLEDGEVLTITLASTVDCTLSGDVYFCSVRTSGDYMDMSDIVSWLQTEFLPLDLATPTSTIEQLVNNAIRYWNTHSGHKISRVYNFNTGTRRVQLDTDFKTVVQVYPTSSTTWIWNDHPLWTLLGISILDNVTTDLILMSEAFRNYRIYVGTDMRWTFDPSQDPNTGGYLYVLNAPNNTTALLVVGTKRITSTDEINNEYILDWILRYSKALLKMVEGNTLRKSSIIGINNDGDTLVREGAEEKRELEEALKRDARWVALTRRF